MASTGASSAEPNNPVTVGEPSNSVTAGELDKSVAVAGLSASGTGPVGTTAYAVPEPDRLTRFVMRLHARAPRWAAPVAALACMMLAAGYTELVDPTSSTADALPTCLLKLTTGLDCPGCGGTRAFWYVLHGDLPAAARHHLVFVFALPFLLYLYVAWAAKQMFGWRLPQLRVTPTMLGVFLAAWGVFSVLRNLPFAPFTWLYV